MRNKRIKIILISTLCILLVAVFYLLFFRPLPSDEEIPRGSRRVGNFRELQQYYIFQI